jgi:hypothetical protein
VGPCAGLRTACPRRNPLGDQPQSQLASAPHRTSEVEVRFVSDGPSRTRVNLDRNLDRYGEGWPQMRDAVGSPDGWKLACAGSPSASRAEPPSNCEADAAPGGHLLATADDLDAAIVSTTTMSRRATRDPPPSTSATPERCESVGRNEEEPEKPKRSCRIGLGTPVDQVHTATCLDQLLRDPTHPQGNDAARRFAMPE